jgi:hypothetical protein
MPLSPGVSHHQAQRLEGDTTMKYLILVAICLLAGCGSVSAPVKKTAPIPISTHYPKLVDQNGNPVTYDPYGLPPAPPM